MLGEAIKNPLKTHQTQHFSASLSPRRVTPRAGSVFVESLWPWTSGSNSEEELRRQGHNGNGG